MTFDVKKFPVDRFDSILKRGLSNGLGTQGSQVCIEAAICESLGLPHGDDPGCVASAVRCFKIALNDSQWSSPEARAKGMRDLGLAQLGSLGVVDDVEFSVRLSKKIISVLIPKLFRQVLSNYPDALKAADVCEAEGTDSAAYSAYSAADSAADSAYSAAYSAYSAAYSAADSAADSAYSAAYSAYSAAYSAADSAYSATRSADSAYSAAYSAARSAGSADAYLILAANLALEVLRELNSPGIQLL